MFKHKTEQITQTNNTDEQLLSLYKIPGLTFEVDSQLLHEIINNGLKAQVTTGISFVDSQLGDRTLIEEDAKKANVEVNRFIIDTLKNTPYEKYMCIKYFGTAEKLYAYTADIVARSIYSVILDMNNKKLERAETLNNMNGISALNTHKSEQ